LRRRACPEVRNKVDEVLVVLSPRRQSRKSGYRNLVQGAGATAGKLAAAREARQGTAGGRGDRPSRTVSGGKPITPARQPQTS
jgi:hypothetical protein